ncbi:hypothetical protein E2K93_03735 [Thalassotalea sp. HSM 43]|uniref:hypothetical protein n=1 Tax=Thalassotalea sp. HSM 43 TaxID=2552945 RepID=UPI001080B13A|nr:hypothetical protein [Thalassotalea sp. HSM 43]QBY03543.1 hypothetical protein E2K93_03735 [Thalassotalea sp. HSM 43]
MKKIIITGLDNKVAQHFGSVLKKSLRKIKNTNVKCLSFDSNLLNSNGKFVLFYSSLESYLADKLKREGFDESQLTESIEQWIEANADILRFYNRNAERCLLINSGCFLEDDFQNKLEKCFKAVFNFNLGELKGLQNKFSQSNKLEIEIIRQLVESKSSEPEGLYADLESVANIYSSEQTDTLSIVDRFKDYCRQNELLEASKKELIALKESTQEIAQQLASADGLIDSLKDENAKLTDENESVFSSLLPLQMEIEELNLKLHRSASRHHENILEKQDELKDKGYELARSEKQVTIKTNALEETRKELRHINWLKNKFEQELAELKLENEAYKKELKVAQVNVQDQNEISELKSENKELVAQLLLTQEKYEELFGINEKLIYQQEINKQTSLDGQPKRIAQITPSISQRRRKLRKLKNSPGLFFVDALKNTFQSKNKLAS